MLSFLAALILSPFALGAATALHEFTDADMLALATKIARAVATCPHQNADDLVVVTLSNHTEDSIDKTKFAALIREELAPKKAAPDTIAPHYEVRGKILSEKSEKKNFYRATYTLKAEVFQDEKKICEKVEKIEKSGKVK